LFDTSRIAAQALRRAEETSKTRSLAPKIAVVTSMFAIVICLVLTIFLTNTMSPADNGTNINPMPVPLAASPSDLQSNSSFCHVCGSEVD